MNRRKQSSPIGIFGEKRWPAPLRWFFIGLGPIVLLATTRTFLITFLGHTTFTNLLKVKSVVLLFFCVLTIYFLPYVFNYTGLSDRFRRASYFVIFFLGIVLAFLIKPGANALKSAIIDRNRHVSELIENNQATLKQVYDEFDLKTAEDFTNKLRELLGKRSEPEQKLFEKIIKDKTHGNIVVGFDYDFDKKDIIYECLKRGSSRHYEFLQKQKIVEGHLPFDEDFEGNKIYPLTVAQRAGNTPVANAIEKKIEYKNRPGIFSRTKNSIRAVYDSISSMF